jgi:hypothetical protein
MPGNALEKRLLRAASSLSLDLIEPTDVHRYALSLLESGAGGWRMAALASTRDSADGQEAVGEFKRALEDEGVRLPPKEEALKCLFCEIVANVLQPGYDPLERIKALYHEAFFKSVYSQVDAQAEFSDVISAVCLLEETDPELRSPAADVLREQSKQAATRYLARQETAE